MDQIHGVCGMFCAEMIFLYQILAKAGFQSTLCVWGGGGEPPSPK